MHIQVINFPLRKEAINPLREADKTGAPRC